MTDIAVMKPIRRYEKSFVRAAVGRELNNRGQQPLLQHA
jgi:hypothetical protein